MGKLKEAAETVQLAPAGGEMQSANQIIAQKIRSQWSRIEAVMPQHMTSERLYQLTISAVNQTPKLLECDIATLLSCVMRCSALGLEPSAVDGMGRAYILPYKNSKTGRMEATFILGYKGMLELARRSGDVLKIEAHAVHAGDDFSFRFGLNPDLTHTPKGGGTRDNMTHVYMIAWLRDAPHPYFDVMTKDEVEDIRKRSKAKDSGAWVTDYEAMAKKTVIRRAFPYLPVSVDAQTAAAADETDGGYVETITCEPLLEAEVASDALEGTHGNGAGNSKPEDEKREEVTEVQIGDGTAEYRAARCRTCGVEFADVYPDATLEDLNSQRCCGRPDFEWVE